MDFRIYWRGNPNGLDHEGELERILAEELENHPKSEWKEVATRFMQIVNETNWLGRHYYIAVFEEW